ncbi:MAG TPA: N-acetyltransferase [Candidatus Saccharimonadia bacterium]|nr:N-acetyltransferase [Candidatus Saccharimonadia bacterium]
MKIQIKKVLIKENAQILYELDNRVDNKSCYLPARSVNEQEQYLQSSDVLIAFAESKPIGFIASKPVEKYVELQSIVVVPQFQGKGVGKELLSKLIETVDGKEIRLVTHPHNTGAIIFYLKSGFRIVGWGDNYYGDGEPRLKLARKL